MAATNVRARTRHLLLSEGEDDGASILCPQCPLVSSPSLLSLSRSSPPAFSPLLVNQSMKRMQTRNLFGVGPSSHAVIVVAGAEQHPGRCDPAHRPGRQVAQPQDHPPSHLFLRNVGHKPGHDRSVTSHHVTSRRVASHHITAHHSTSPSGPGEIGSHHQTAKRHPRARHTTHKRNPLPRVRQERAK